MDRSDQINELAAALAKAQGQMRAAKKDSSNPFFKSSYADLSSVWDACQGPLSANGLCVIQTPARTEGGVELTTMLAHSSGQWVCSVLEVRPAKDDPQGIGSAITYIRRYALSAMVGVVAEDDDGEAAMGRVREAKKASSKTAAKPQVDEVVVPASGEGSVARKLVSEAQLKRLYAIMKAHGWAPDEVKKWMWEALGKEHSKDLDWVEYNHLCQHLVTRPKVESHEDGSHHVERPQQA